MLYDHHHHLAFSPSGQGKNLVGDLKLPIHHSAELKHLVVELRGVDWRGLGVQLDIPGHKLNDIGRENPGNEARKLEIVLQYWIDQGKDVTWETIVKVLQRIGGHGGIINTIGQKYIK